MIQLPIALLKQDFKKSPWRVNEQIRAPQLRVIGQDKKQVGVLTREEALAQASKEGVDIIEIAPKANPPVAQLIDFGKFRYQQEKRLKDQKKKAKAAEVKEVRFSPFIGEADYKTRIKRVSEFLTEGNKVRIVVVFKGRQMNSKNFGYKLVQRILGDIESTIVIDMEPKFLGRHLASVISPVKKKKSDNKKAEE